MAQDVDEVVRLASVADRFDIVVVEEGLDRIIASCLTPEAAAHMLVVCRGGGRFPHSAATARCHGHGEPGPGPGAGPARRAEPRPGPGLA